LTETRDEWLARLDQFLEIAAPAEQIIEGGFEFYTAVPHFPLVEVRPAALRELLESHGLTPPDAYRGLVELHPAELGADSEARYILADARDPLGDDPVCEVDEAPGAGAAGRDDPGAGRPGPAGDRSEGPRPPRSADRFDPLAAISERLALARRTVRMARRQLAVDPLAVMSLDGYIAGLEYARLALTGDRSPRRLIR
jgi:hypothetical protein